ncbi:MAG: hypothetical protein WAJ85_14185 [Candidatus Baltobacteraceae bacterium]|jgi:hypothetical protein
MKDEAGRDPNATATGARALATRRVRYHAARLQTSPQFAAVLDVLFDLPKRTEPAFVELVMADGRLLFARTPGDRDFRHYCGRREELLDNLAGLCRHLHLGVDERAYVFAQVEGIPQAEIIL